MPTPTAALGADADGRVRAAIAVQEECGLDLISDGGQRHRDRVTAITDGLTGFQRRRKRPMATAQPAWTGPILVDGWRFAAGCTGRAVKQALIGPYTLGRAVAAGDLGRERVTLALAEALNAEIHALAEAGCPVVEVVEDGATSIDDSPAERGLFADAQRRLLAGLGDDVHRTLAIRGGNAEAAGVETIVDRPYQSFLFDLCAGPDNWRVAVKVPGDRGVIVGAADARAARLDELELLVYAIGYAASTMGRGHQRVGLATSADMVASIPWERALAKIRRIGETAAYYEAPAGTLAEAMDPRAIDIRSAAHGRYAPASYDPASPARFRKDRPRRGRTSGGAAATDETDPSGTERAEGAPPDAP
jgi:methionine synthase II (cobalamin-independent)